MDEDWIATNEVMQLKARIEYLERELKAIQADLEALEQDYLAVCSRRDDEIERRIAAEQDKEDLIAALSK